MKKVIESIKEFPINLVLFVLLIGLYYFNNYFLKIHTNGFVNYVLVNHFNDFLCGCVFTAYSNIFLNTRKIMITNFFIILIYCFLAGIFWEFITPLFSEDSTPDWIDVGCYLLGGILYWFLINIELKRKKLKNGGVE